MQYKYKIQYNTKAKTKTKNSPVNHPRAQWLRLDLKEHENVSNKKTERGILGVISAGLSSGISQKFSTGPYRILQVTHNPLKISFKKTQTSLC